MQLTAKLLHTTDAYIKSLEKSEVKTVYDLINHYPRDYEDRTNVLDTFTLLSLKEKNTILVTLLTIDTTRTGNNKLLTKAVFEDKNGFLAEGVWFNRQYFASQTKRFEGKKVLVSGKVKYDYGKLVFNSPDIETDLSKIEGEIVPIYPDINYIPGKWLLGKMTFLKKYFADYHETLPEHIVKKYGFISKQVALEKIHFPKNKDDIENAKKRLAYEELYEINYFSLSKKYEVFKNSEGKSPAIPLDPELVKTILTHFPFELTNHQKIALFQVLKDMENTHAMQRLLEGDVGTGKTAVAAIASIHSILQMRKKNISLQVAVMAPTEILSRQHFAGLQTLFLGFGITSELLVGSTTAKEKVRIKEALRDGNLDVVIGTHALIQEDVIFKNLGFVVVDEQHRFGVKQREVLEKFFSPLDKMAGEGNEQSINAPLRKGEEFSENSENLGGFIPYKKDLVLKAKELRKNMTPGEKKLWYDFLKNLELPVLRQKPLLDYIVDFYISSCGVVIEIDGESHFEENQIEYDKKRTKNLEKYNLKVLRYTNTEIIDSFEGVCNDILHHIEERKRKRINILKSPNPLYQGGKYGIPQPPLSRGQESAYSSGVIQENITQNLTEQQEVTHFLSNDQEITYFGSRNQEDISNLEREQDINLPTPFIKGAKNNTLLIKEVSGGTYPHSLNMTATPIPRTLALTLYGDQDLSIISEYPKGRKDIYTKVAKNDENRREIELFVRSEVGKGRQVFWVSPLVEQSEKIDLANAVKTYESLVDIFAPFCVGLLHGRMKPKEKEAIMAQFKAGEIQILSSTSVIEVGVDIPNATIMCIEGAERFGLSQLHQFRGRVGRGQYQSYCYLFPTSGQPTDRLRAMEKTNNGFELAEIDLEIRGPGEVYGVRQSGLPDLKIADMRDLGLVSQIREDIESELKKKK